MVGFISISTLVVSIADMMLTGLLACCTGRLKMETWCCVVEHDEDGDKITPDDIDKIVERRMSQHN